MTKATVYYFTKENFEGLEEAFSSTYPYDQLDGSGVSDDTTFLGHFGSLIVTRGECETTTDAGSSFPAPDTTVSYYDANKGVNGQGCFPTLKSDDKNKVRALRTQRDDIIRPTTSPYLVLRSGAGRDDAVSLIINADTPSIEAFSTEMAFAIGSSSGEWALFSEENYRGEVIILKVDEGEDGQGVHFGLNNFIVRSAYQAKIGSYLSYDPGKLSKYIIKNNGYSTLSNIKIRLSGKDDVSKSLSSGQSITIDFNKDSQGTRCMMMYDGALIQQVDFNDGKSADDLDLSEFNGNQTGQARYNAGDSSDEQFITMKYGKYTYLNYWYDTDGIDGHGFAVLYHELSPDGSTLTMNISSSYNPPAPEPVPVPYDSIGFCSGKDYAGERLILSESNDNIQPPFNFNSVIIQNNQLWHFTFTDAAGNKHTNYSAKSNMADVGTAFDPDGLPTPFSLLSVTKG